MSGKKSKQILKRGLGFLIVLALLTAATNHFLSVRFKKQLLELLTKEINERSKGSYVIDFEDFRVNILGGNATIQKLHLYPEFGLQPNDTTLPRWGALTIEQVRLSRPDIRFRNKKPYEIKNFALHLAGIRYTQPDSLYYLAVSEAGFQLSDSTLRLNGILYRSFVGEYEFAANHPRHSDWMDVTADELRVEGLSIRRWVEADELFISHIFLERPVFKSFKNQKIPSERHLMPLLYEQIQTLPFPFLIGEITVENFDIYYRELASDGIVPGEIRFLDMNISANDLTNIVSRPQQTNKLLVDTRFMGKGEMKLELLFPVDTAYNRVEIRGTLGPMDMISLNSILEPLNKVRIKDGLIQGMDLVITGNRERAEIEMCLLYQQLAVEIYKRGENNERYYHPLLSYLATGVLEKSNPKTGSAPRRVRAEYFRDPYHSSFNYLWKVFQAGFYETLGYTRERREKLGWAKQEIDKLRSTTDGK